jgi:hypothetical protein
VRMWIEYIVASFVCVAILVFNIQRLPHLRIRDQFVDVLKSSAAFALARRRVVRKQLGALAAVLHSVVPSCLV